MSGSMDLLHCPSCQFSVSQEDEYVLQLHFEQVHVEDSPFRIEGDAELLPPSLPPRHSLKRAKHEEDTPSEDEDDSESLPRLPPRPSSKAPKNTPDTPSEEEDDNTVLCPEPDCGELILLSDFNEHLDYHAAETLSFDETTGKYRTHQSASMHSLYTTANSATLSKPSFLEHNFNTALPPDALRRNDDGRKLKKKGPRGRGDSSGSEKSTLSRSMMSFVPYAKFGKKVKPPPIKGKLGRDELGPYHDEDRMPRWLHNQLADGPKITVVNRIGRDGRLIKQETVENETPGIMPILAQLSALDHSVKEAYYCHPSTLHIGKTKREGGFCGYRNIQMLVSYIQGARAQGMEEFPGRTPGILTLQDFIERAWDKGINEIGRIQTGGIRDSRKYIGTPEAQALFLSHQIDCAVEMFSDSPDGEWEAHEALLLAVERYFAQGAVKTDGSNVYKTHLPPIYLQQPGHSTTIVGFERHKNGSCNLMIFDPMHRTSPAMHRLIGRKNIKHSRPEVMFPYRRAAKSLRRHAAFEVLRLTAHPPMVPVWDMLRQFPDCRFLYVFFRSRTLGYDVYPEDHFLRNFPWQQYGGLWVVGEARFARSDNMNPLTAQALRRITGEGSCATASRFSSSNGSGSFNSGSFNGGVYNPVPLNGASINQHALPSPRAMRSGASTRLPSFMSSLDGSLSTVSEVGWNSNGNQLDSILEMYKNCPAPIPYSSANFQVPNLSLMTELGKKYPGYPSPLSPTGDAKTWYPSPVSESGSGIATPRAGSSAPRTGTPNPSLGSPMSIGGSNTCGPSRPCASHGYPASDDGNLPPIGTKSPCSSTYRSKGVPSPPPLRTLTRSPSASSISPISPPRALSARTAMLKKMVGKQAHQNMSHGPSFSPNAAHHAWPSPSPSSDSFSQTLPILNLGMQSPQSVRTSTPTSTPTSIEIFNGTETLTPSSPSGTSTMLSYRSHRRAEESGFLGVKSLSESQVAEYRFWMPCGRRTCAFGCGSGSEGEWEASKRLFRDEEEVLPKEDCDDAEGEDTNEKKRDGDEVYEKVFEP